MLTDEELLTRLKSVPSYALAHDIVLSSEQFEAAMMALARAVERAAYEKAALACGPRGQRSCACDSCDCGNLDDAQSVAAWDAEARCAVRVRALITQEQPT